MDGRHLFREIHVQAARFAGFKFAEVGFFGRELLDRAVRSRKIKNQKISI